MSVAYSIVAATHTALLTSPVPYRLNLRVRLVKLLTVGHLGQWFALLLALTDCLRWVAERENGQNIQVVGNVQQRLHRLQAVEANPVRPHTLGPRRQQHGLNCTAGISDSKWAFVNRDDNRQRSLGNIGTTWRQCAKLVERVTVLDHNEVSGLCVHATGSQAACLDNLLDNCIWHRSSLIVPHGKERAHGLKDVHGWPPFVCSNCYHPR